MSEIQRHQDVNERIQHELELIAHPELCYAGDWLELRASRSRWYTWCTPQNNREENTSRGQYKEHVLSRYHRPTQNRNQYTLNNNIKTTTILNRRQATKHMNHWQQYHNRYTINHNIKHTYEDSCLHTILIWKTGSLRKSIFSYFKIPFL